jgi:hypothetical protein
MLFPIYNLEVSDHYLVVARALIEVKDLRIGRLFNGLYLDPIFSPGHLYLSESPDSRGPCFTFPLESTTPLRLLNAKFLSNRRHSAHGEPWT